MGGAPFSGFESGLIIQYNCFIFLGENKRKHKQMMEIEMIL